MGGFLITGENASREDGGLPDQQLERATGLEPVTTIWRTAALPLSYTRIQFTDTEQIACQPRNFSGKPARPPRYATLRFERGYPRMGP